MDGLQLEGGGSGPQTALQLGAELHHVPWTEVQQDLSELVAGHQEDVHGWVVHSVHVLDLPHRHLKAEAVETLDVAGVRGQSLHLTQLLLLLIPQLKQQGKRSGGRGGRHVCSDGVVLRLAPGIPLSVQAAQPVPHEHRQHVDDRLRSVLGLGHAYLPEVPRPRDPVPVQVTAENLRLGHAFSFPGRRAARLIVLPPRQRGIVHLLALRVVHVDGKKEQHHGDAEQD